MVHGQQQTFIRTEPVIDHVWVDEFSVVSAYPELCAQLAARLAAMAIAPDYLANLEANPDMKHFLLSESSPTSHVWMLGGSQQAAFVEELLAHPELLRSVSREGIFRLYQACRVRCLDTALHLLGRWAQMHPMAEAQFSRDMYKDNCMDYCVAAYSLARQYPPHLDSLERDYLVLPDGGCCLPTAYVLATGHSMQGHVEEWIENLNSQLKDDKLRGDKRVSWLFARAWAEEIRHAGATGHQFPRHHFLAGHGWLEEACLIAKSEPVRLRAYKELAVRLAGEEQSETARKLLARAGNRCTSAASVESLGVWRQEIDHVAQSNTQSQKGLEIAAQQAYWNEIRARYREAVRTGDQEEVSRYRQALNKAGVEP